MELLGAGGSFETALSGFAPREGQIRLAGEIGEAIEAGEHLVAEAGTGIGKTFAYLAPILAGHRRAIISTATRTLQDQIFEHDLPLVARAMGRPLEVAVLKGRDNYLCRERWLRLGEDWVGFGGSPFDNVTLTAWARASGTGDLAELKELGERSGLRRMLTVSAEACLGADCPEYGRCHVYAARRRAQEADVAIVNHHLLLADLRLKQEGFAEGLLGSAQVVVVDEAHALPEIARSALGDTLSRAQLEELADDVARVFGSVENIRRPALALSEALRLPAVYLEPGRFAWSDVRDRLAPVVDAVTVALTELAAELAAFPEGALLSERARTGAARMAQWADAEHNVERMDEADFRWVDVSANGQLSLHASPLEPGATLSAWIEDSGASWIFTSATLAVAGNFDNFIRQIGLDTPRRFLEGSPFDYEHQSLLYLPPDMPAPNEEDHTEAVIAAAEPLIRAAQGGCFLLFTSRKALQCAAELLRARNNLPNPLFVQDEAPQARLLDAFRCAGNGVLCGTASFWKGVDVKGDALVLVVIDRLPFAWPDDPLFKARLAHCRAGGGKPFVDIQIPEAVLALKQGAGRLIRDGADRGVLAICDPRLRTRGYGRTFLSSLPAMPVTKDAHEAAAFLAKGRSA